MEKGRLIVAASVDCADLLYACGFKAPDPFVFFAVKRDKGIIVSKLEYGRAVNQSKDDVSVYQDQDILGETDVQGSMSTRLQALSEKLGVAEWDVPPEFPVQYADKLRDTGVKVTCSTDRFFPERSRKSADEIEKIAQAMVVTEDAMARARDVLADSSVADDGRIIWAGEPLTSARLRAEINVLIVRRGGMPSDTIVAGGPQGAEPHNTGHGVLRAASPIIVDIFPRMDDTGYWGDMTRTFVKGRAPEIVGKAFVAVKEARDRAKDKLRAGITGEDAYNIALKTLEKHGFKTGRKDEVDYGFIHGLGHGVGLEIHEPPRLSPANQNELQAGNVVTVEPGVYYPEWGGIRLEDMVVIRKDGIDCFNKFETVLEID